MHARQVKIILGLLIIVRVTDKSSPTKVVRALQEMAQVHPQVNFMKSDTWFYWLVLVFSFPSGW